MARSAPFIGAHRGSVNGVSEKENTLAAFEHAIQRGASFIETDIRRTKDGVLVCYHDPTWHATPLAALHYREWIAETKRQGWTVPRLEEVLQYCQGRIKLDLELKEIGYESEVLSTATSFFSIHDMIFTSFHDQSLAAIKHQSPNVKTGLLLGQSLYHRRFRLALDLYPERRLRRLQADAVFPHYQLLRANFIKRMHRLHYPVVVWTVNETKKLKEMIRKGVDGIITDRVIEAKKVLQQFTNGNE